MKADGRVNPIYFIVLAGILIYAAMVFADSDTTTISWVVPANVSHTLTYAANCAAGTLYFDERDANFDSDIDGNAGKILPHGNSDATANDAVCQTDALAPILITNDGSVDLNIQMDFNAAITTGINLKTWLGTDSGCGTDGLGGWQQSCTAILADVNMIGTTWCIDRNGSAATTAINIINKLMVSDTNQLCFASDFISLAAGTYNVLFDTVGVQT